MANPTIPANEALINTNADCQRTALLGFLQSRVGINDGLPIRHPQRTTAVLGKLDAAVNAANHVSGSWNFNHSRKENETFDVATYGNSANGIEGDPARINVVNLNWFTTLSTRMVNEAHFTYSRETRPRTAAGSGLTADTGMGFGPTFRFGDPFFLQPGVDELIWRTQFKDNVSIVSGDHTFKVGGEWMHTMNDQVFRGFFTGRYIFNSVSGFLRYASPAAAGGFGPEHGGLFQRRVRDLPGRVPGRIDDRRRTAAAVSAGGGPHGPGHRCRRRVDDHQRRVLAVRAGLVAGPPEPHRQLRLAVGRPDHAGDRGSHHDGVCLGV